MNTPTSIRLATFKVTCLIAYQLIQSLMVHLSLMTTREMRRVIDSLECIQTANLLTCDSLYFAFGNHPEFEHEQYYWNSEETATADEIQLIIKGQKTPFGLLTLSDELLKLI